MRKCFAHLTRISEKLRKVSGQSVGKFSYCPGSCLEVQTLWSSQNSILVAGPLQPSTVWISLPCWHWRVISLCPLLPWVQPDLHGPPDQSVHFPGSWEFPTYNTLQIAQYKWPAAAEILKILAENRLPQVINCWGMINCSIATYSTLCSSDTATRIAPHPISTCCPLQCWPSSVEPW